jgi:RluA family pseudouridine synthase
MAGAIAVNGRPVRRPGLVLQAGCRVEARVDLARLSGSRPASAGVPLGSAFAAPSTIEILYRDRWLLAVAKPPGLLVHASADSRRADLFSLLRRQCAEGDHPRDDPTEGPYLGLHQRLDVETSGVMLFTVDPAANPALARAFAGHRVEKVYHALVARPTAPLPERWTEQSQLALTGTGRRARMSVVRSGGMAAETAFGVVRRLHAALLVEARPKTGRKHQIRAHLAARHVAILGDARYGGAMEIAGVRIPRVMLHACALRLAHPVTGAPLEIRCPYPPDFRDLLNRLELSVGFGALDTPSASR